MASIGFGPSLAAFNTLLGQIEASSGVLFPDTPPASLAAFDPLRADLFEAARVTSFTPTSVTPVAANLGGTDRDYRITVTGLVPGGLDANRNDTLAELIDAAIAEPSASSPRSASRRRPRHRRRSR